MSTCQTHRDTPPTNPPSFHLFPLLPYELRIEIWRAAFPPHSVEPLLRVSATSKVVENGNPDISYTFKVVTDTTIFHAFSTPEYLAPFLTTCIESRDLYIEYFNLTCTLPSNTSIPIYYAPTTTIYVENGLFISPDTAVMDTLKSIPTTTVILPPFFNQIQNLALPLSHFDDDIMCAYDLYSSPTSPTTDWPPSPVDPSLVREHEETYDVPALNRLGCIFSRLTSLKNLYVVIAENYMRHNNALRDFEIADADDAANSLSDVLRYFKRDIYVLDGEWEPPKVSVLQGLMTTIEGEDDDVEYDPSTP